MLALSSGKRLPDFPQVPTIAETFPGYELYVWASMVVRAETPEPIFRKLATSMKKALESPDTIEYAKQAGFDRNLASPEDMLRFQQEQFERIREVAKQANIGPE